jgi:hypothetical protein
MQTHLQAVYYNYVKFHLNPISRLGGVALTSPSLHTERISEYIISPSKLWTATIFMLQLILSLKGGMYLVSATPTKLLIEFI